MRWVGDAGYVARGRFRAHLLSDVVVDHAALNAAEPSR
jgi:hypothetical protein